MLEVLERGRRPAKLSSAKRESDEAARVNRSHSALVLVDRKYAFTQCSGRHIAPSIDVVSM